MYLMRPTGNPQVIRHPQHLNLDPQGPVATGEPDPQVTLPAGIPTVYLQVTFVDLHPCPALLHDPPGFPGCPLIPGPPPFPPLPPYMVVRFGQFLA